MVQKLRVYRGRWCATFRWITAADGLSVASVANTVPRPASYPSSTVPFQRDEKFVGREEALERINTVLSRQGRHNRFALTGLGGIGYVKNRQP